MEIPLIAYPIVCLASLVAGVISAAAGGGGLVSLPVFMLAGMPPHAAIATNKFQMLCANCTSLARFARQGKVVWRNAVPMAIVGALGSFIGSNAALYVSGEAIVRITFFVLPAMAAVTFRKLSGGERRRLYLLRVLAQGANVLLLDEPTNDLDIATLTILEDFLETFNGIIITVSHDRYFLDAVVDRIFAFEDGHLQQYEGGYTEYLEAKARREVAAIGSGQVKGAAAPKMTAAGSKASATADSNKDWKEERKQNQPVKLKFTYKEQREFETIDDDIAALEEKLANIEVQMEEYASSYTKLTELTAEKEAVEAELEEKMERWEYLNDLAEKIEAQK